MINFNEMIQFEIKQTKKIESVTDNDDLEAVGFPKTALIKKAIDKKNTIISAGDGAKEEKSEYVGFDLNKVQWL